MPRKKKTYRGTGFMPDEPNWDRLRAAGGEWLLGKFMAMNEVELENGVNLCCYKHIDSRRSLHLDPELNAYLYFFDDRKPGESGRYKPVPLDEAFALVVLQPEFADGWFERGRSDRPWIVDEDGNEVEEGDSDYEVSRFEERMANERWERHRALLSGSPVPGGE